MGYSRRRYAQFSTGETVRVEVHHLQGGTQMNEAIVEQVHLDLVNDTWMYRLRNLPGWFSQDSLSKPLPAPLPENKEKIAASPFPLRVAVEGRTLLDVSNEAELHLVRAALGAHCALSGGTVESL